MVGPAGRVIAVDIQPKMLSGLQRSDLVILAARPSLGKSTLALNIAANMAVNGKDSGSLSVIDLKSDYIHVVGTVGVAPSPEGLALSADGKYVAASSLNGSNFVPGTPGFRDFGLVQVFRRNGFALKLIATAKAGHWCEGLVWSANHRKLLLQCMVEKEIQVFSFDGKSLKRNGSIPIPNGPAGFRVAE